MPTPDDELRELFSAFDDVSASDQLKDATATRILAEKQKKVHDPALSLAPQDEPARRISASDTKSPAVKKKANWRAMRIVVVAACLALALTGGIAYATPISYYDVTQDGATISLGVNCFGVTVSATSSDEKGQELIGKMELCNVPYEESLARAIESMEERDPGSPVKYGPQNGEHEVAQAPGALSKPDASSESEEQGDTGVRNMSLDAHNTGDQPKEDIQGQSGEAQGNTSSSKTHTNDSGDNEPGGFQGQERK